MLTKRYRGLAATAAVAALAIAVAACSSSGSSSSTSSTSPVTSSSSASASPTSSASAPAAEQAPTSITETVPLKSKPAPGKLFIWMNCDLDTCPPIGAGVQAAVEAVGWKFREINFQAENPATLVTAMKEALQYHPAYVGLSGLDPTTGWSSVIPLYKAAGVKIIASFLGNETYNSTFIANIGGATLAEAGGDALADWFISDSHGQGRAVLQRVDEFATLKIVADSFVSTVQANCPDCKVLSLENTVSQATSGAVVPAVVSELRSNPSYDYVIASAANLVTGLPAALSAAGLSSRVKYAAYAATPDSLTALKDGQAAAMVGNPLHYVGWAMVDTALRDSEGMSFAPDPEIPFQLLLPSSNFTVSDSQDVPADYQSQFEKLWLLG